MSSPGPTAMIPTSTTTVTGPMLIGYLVNWSLFGILTVQVYLYHISFPSDNRRVKGGVFLAYTLETAQVILSTVWMYNAYAKGWGDYSKLDSVVAACNDLIFFPVVVALSQEFYAWRIYMLSRSRWIPCIIMMSSTTAIFCSIWVGVVCVGEIIITISMLFHLSLARRNSQVMQTQSLVTYLMRLSVETSFICAAVGTAGFILSIILPTTGWYLPFVLAAGKLVTNCFTATLNSRIRIVGDRNDEDSDVITAMSSLNAATPAVDTAPRVVSRVYQYSSTVSNTHCQTTVADLA
ncbi:hypothetical protein BXZ70DRAFT_911106 [Cristinia sonorae]|uniref:DUF6534 domain-containing protein n=1 Tax=Cristinia sonorae TaxID=1940300 RepID=A0A8K0XK15_9AGAR|nr:hypothetical protein BXZ70DRAFT_911106 [Cristinia sonorae]